jgi:predicted DNA-binding transcriptional regulator AlpA
MLGVSRRRVHPLVADDPTFPKPAAVLKGGSSWERAPVEEWP